MTSAASTRQDRFASWPLPAPYCMDPRSLALFRILLAVYLATDVVGRWRNGWASLSWYTSQTDSIFNDNLPPIFHEKDVFYDNPDSVLHSIWCWRGTPTHQVALFAVHILLIASFGVGGRWFAVVPMLLWISTTSTVCRSADAFFNDLGDIMGYVYLFWTMYVPHLGATPPLPLPWRRSRQDRKASLPANEETTTIATSPPEQSIPTKQPNKKTEDNSALRQRRRRASENSHDPLENKSSKQQQNQDNKSQRTTLLPAYHYQPVCGLPALVLAIQMVIVYIAIMFGRREEKAWWYPSGEAVYYAMSSLRYTRPIVAELVQEYFPITRFMTFGAMCSEFTFPLLCFLAPYDQYTYDTVRRVHVRTYKSWRYIPALGLCFFHLTLWASIRIPALQIICASIPVIFIPGSFWDDVGWRPRENDHEETQDDPHPNRLLPGRAPPPSSLKLWLRNGKNLVRTILLSLMIPAMLANYVSTMEWMKGAQPFGLGIVGALSKSMDALFLFQEWRIFKGVPSVTMGVLFVGYYEGADPYSPRKDILAVFRENDWSNKTDISFDTYAQWSAQINANISAQMGHWRLESFLMEPDGLQDYKDDYTKKEDWFRLDRLNYFICKWGNSELAKANDPRRLTELEMIFQMVKILPPSRPKRLKRKYDIVYTYDCDEEPEEVEPGRFVYPRSERLNYDPFEMDMLGDLE